MNRATKRWDLRRAACSAPALALALAGCVTAPDVRGPALASPEAALRSRAAVVAGEPALAETAVPSQWWDLFGDATLIALEAEATESNLDLQSAAARIEESRARLGLADAARQPQLAADAGYTRSAISEHSPLAVLGAPTRASDTWLLGLEAGWELTSGGACAIRANPPKPISKPAATARRRSGCRSRRKWRTPICSCAASRPRSVAEQNRQLADGLVRMAESRERHGVATRFDAAAARADVAGIDARLSQLHHKREALMNALALLLGKPPRELDDRLAAAALPAMPKRLPVGIPSELARQRPDILQADARLRAAVADIGAAEADFYPRISLTGSAGVQAFDFSDLGSWASRRYAFGPTLYLPIFEGGRLKSNLALSAARHRLAAIAYQQTVLRAWHEVDDALGAYASELRRHAQLQLALDQNQTALKVAQRAYQQGTADFTAVLVAQRSLLASHAELIDCSTASALSVVGLYRALGGGWSSQLRADAAPSGSAS